MAKSDRKAFVLDTSVIIHDPKAIFYFGNNDVIIPIALISEIDGFKTGNDQKAYNAREFSRMLDSFKENRSTTLLELDDIEDVEGGKICISGASADAHAEIPKEIEFNKGKDRAIIATALKWKYLVPDQDVYLISKDINVRLLGHTCGIFTEDYERDQVKDYTKLTHIQHQIIVDNETIDRLMIDKFIPVDDLKSEEGFKLNQCVTLVSEIEPNKSVLATCLVQNGQKVLFRLLSDKQRSWGITPRNREQIFAMSLLMNPKIKLVSLIGKAGTGKTLMALAAGLEQTCEKDNIYHKVVVLRPIIPVGRDIGYLPGDVSSKMAPWVKPVMDNLSVLIGEDKKDNQNGGMSSYQYLFDSGIIEVEVMSFIRGRSINNAFIIIDEAQNLTRHEIKTLLTRVSGESKVILTGDLQQIDVPYLDAHSSGLTHVVKKFDDDEIAGFVYLQKGERSLLAEKAANLL